MTGLIRLGNVKSDELVVRLFEAMVDLKRPPDQSLDRTLSWLHDHFPDEYRKIDRMASAALAYFEECLRDDG